MLNSKSTEELENIINSREEYTTIAKRVAKDIIDAGRPNCKKVTIDLVYEDIHKIARDLRFIKNVFIFGLICAVVIGILLMIRGM